MKFFFNKLSAKRRTAFLAMIGVLLLALGAGILLLTGDSSYTVTTFSMGSYVQQTVYGANREEGARQAAAAAAELEDLISWRKENSDIARINEAAGSNFVSIDAQTEEILSASLSICEKSGGALDITIAPISRLWNFDDTPCLPEDSMIQKFRKMVDYTTLSLPGDGTAALQAYGTALDLGAVGKGAACDAAVAAYRESGVQRAIVAVGGSVGLFGEKPFGKAWTVAVRDPAGSESLGLLSLREGFVSTSGSYEKCFTENGKTYHHLLDPATGYPAESGLVSVTVWSSSGVLSDGLSTACFVLGLEKSLPLLDEFDAGAVFVTEDDKVYVTENLEAAFSLSASGYTQEKLS